MLANALISPGITLLFEYQIGQCKCYYCLFSLSVCHQRAFPVSWSKLFCRTVILSEVHKWLTFFLVKHFSHLWNRRKEGNRILPDLPRVCRTDQSSSSTHQTSKSFKSVLIFIDCISVWVKVFPKNLLIHGFYSWKLWGWHLYLRVLKPHVCLGENVISYHENKPKRMPFILFYKMFLPIFFVLCFLIILTDSNWTS